MHGIVRLGFLFGNKWVRKKSPSKVESPKNLGGTPAVPRDMCSRGRAFLVERSLGFGISHDTFHGSFMGVPMGNRYDPMR